jgi:hypothetical protein
MNSIRFGSDLGSTIVNTATRRAYPDVFRVLKNLVKRLGPAELFIISRVNEVQKVRAESWIANDGLFEMTGMLPENLFWCAERHEKGPIAEKLGLTHFVDDRPEVLIHMPLVPHRILFNPRQEEVDQFRGRLGGISIVSSWLEIEAMLAQL